MFALSGSPSEKKKAALRWDRRAERIHLCCQTSPREVAEEVNEQRELVVDQAAAGRIIKHHTTIMPPDARFVGSPGCTSREIEYIEARSALSQTESSPNQGSFMNSDSSNAGVSEQKSRVVLRQ